MLLQQIFAEDFGTLGAGGNLGPFAGKAGGTNGLQLVTKGISGVIGFLTVMAVIWFLFQFTIGGITWISAGGDKGKLTESRDRLSNAIIGLTVVVAGWGILVLLGQFFGVDFTLSGMSLSINP